MAILIPPSWPSKERYDDAELQRLQGEILMEALQDAKALLETS